MNAPLRNYLLSRCVVNAVTGCWEWISSKDRDGYGKARFDGRTLIAHRAVYELLEGPIPEGLTLDHLCRNRACVNPGHLEPVTLAENLRRSPLRRQGSLPRRQPQQGKPPRTHCSEGHELTPENTYARKGKDGTWPSCRRCRAETQRKYRQANKEHVREVERAYRPAYRERTRAHRQRPLDEAEGGRA